MSKKQTIHIVGGTSRCRAEQAHLVFSLGHHSEIYTDTAELMRHPPKTGIVLARDGPSRGEAVTVLRAVSSQGWIPVIATAREPRPVHVVDAIKGGVVDYMSLPLRPDRLSQSIARIVSNADDHAEARRKIAEARSRIAHLSPREREVLNWLTEGCSNKIIARELEISPRTVEIHRANMMQKLDADHLVQAVRLFFEARLDLDCYAIARAGRH